MALGIPHQLVNFTGLFQDAEVLIIYVCPPKPMLMVAVLNIIQGAELPLKKSLANGDTSEYNCHKGTTIRHE